MPGATIRISCPVIPILISGLVHFSLASLALVGLLNEAYIFTHIVLVLVALWCSRDKTSLEPVLAYIYVVMFSGLVDMIVLGIWWDDFFSGSSKNRFYASIYSMVIINLLFKPTSVLFSLLVIYTRNGGLDFTKFFKSFTTSGDDYAEIGGNSDVENGTGEHN